MFVGFGDDIKRNPSPKNTWSVVFHVGQVLSHWMFSIGLLIVYWNSPFPVYIWHIPYIYIYIHRHICYVSILLLCYPVVADITLRDTLSYAASPMNYIRSREISQLWWEQQRPVAVSACCRTKTQRRDVVHMIHVGRNETGSWFKRCKNDLGHVGTDLFFQHSSSCFSSCKWFWRQNFGIQKLNRRIQFGQIGQIGFHFNEIFWWILIGWIITPLRTT